MSDKMQPQDSESHVNQPHEGIDYAESNNVSRIHEQIQREPADPEQGSEPISLWGIGFVMVVLALGFMYFGMFSAGFKGDAYDERGGSAASTADAGAVAAEDPAAVLIKSGKRVFQANCQACHQATGGGVPGVYPPLAGSPYVLGNEERMVSIILGGLQGPIEVEGTVYNNVMVSWAPTLSDAQISAVASYLRQEWGNEAPPVSEEVVTRMREVVAKRTGAWTAEDLAKAFGK